MRLIFHVNRQSIQMKYQALFATIEIRYMRGSRKFCQRGSKFDKVFFSWWGEKGSKYHFKRVIIDPPAKCHLNGVSLACRWWHNIECWLGGSVIFQGIRTSIAKKTYILLFFRGIRTPCPIPLWIRAYVQFQSVVSLLNATETQYKFWTQAMFKDCTWARA